MIFIQLKQQLELLLNLLNNLDDAQYTCKISHLSNSSIGGHSRHIIELLQCAINGYSLGEIDYVNRTRDLSIEENRSIALSLIKKLQENCILPDKNITMVVDQVDGSKQAAVTTSYFREVVYNTEHIIHHLALIKVALVEIKHDLVAADFGMAYSTIKYKEAMNVSN